MSTIIIDLKLLIIKFKWSQDWFKYHYNSFMEQFILKFYHQLNFYIKL